MSYGDLIRPYDPFSGHATESVDEEADTTEFAPPELAPAPEPPAEPIEPKAEEPKKPAPKRRGRRPRRVPTASEVEQTRRRVKP